MLIEATTLSHRKSLRCLTSSKPRVQIWVTYLHGELKKKLQFPNQSLHGLISRFSRIIPNIHLQSVQVIKALQQGLIKKITLHSLQDSRIIRRKIILLGDQDDKSQSVTKAKKILRGGLGIRTIVKINRKINR